MRIHNIYVDAQGETHFRDIEVEWVEERPGGKLSRRLPATGIIFRQTGGDYDLDWHPAPRRQYIINLRRGADHRERRRNPDDRRRRGAAGGGRHRKGHLSKAVNGQMRHSIFVRDRLSTAPALPLPALRGEGWGEGASPASLVGSRFVEAPSHPRLLPLKGEKERITVPVAVNSGGGVMPKQLDTRSRSSPGEPRHRPRHRREFAAEGAKTVLVARRAALLDEVVAGIRQKGGEALPHPADLTREDEIVALFAMVQKTFGRLDVLVNNAGISTHRETEDITLDYWRAALDINITAPFLCAREAVRLMKAQTPKGGRIINIGSVSAKTPRPDCCPTR